MPLRPCATSRACARCSPICPAPMRRRADEDATTAKAEPAAASVPDYYAQDFHFQTGGYLTRRLGAALRRAGRDAVHGCRRPDAPRRPAAGGGVHAGPRPAARHPARCRLRHGPLPAPGAARLSRHERSRASTCRALSRRGAPASRGPARGGADRGRRREACRCRTPASISSRSIFLFHELPPDVRRQVTAEIARVLKPGGLFVFLDSLQMGDKPGWDGLIEAFPHRFHEPYYRHYAIDDLDGHVHGGRTGAGHDHHAVPVQADGAGQAVRRLSCRPRAIAREPVPRAACRARGARGPGSRIFAFGEFRDDSAVRG